MNNIEKTKLSITEKSDNNMDINNKIKDKKLKFEIGLFSSILFIILFALSSYIPVKNIDYPQEIISTSEKILFFLKGSFQVPIISSLLMQLLLIFLPFFIAYKIKDKSTSILNGFKKLGLKNFNFKQLFSGLKFIPLVYIVFAIYGYFLTKYNIKSQADELAPMIESVKDTPALTFLLLFLAVILAPITEELLFRGVIFTSLNTKLSYLLSTITTSFVFTVIHGLPSSYPPIFLLAIVLNHLRNKYDSLYPPMFLHAFNNALAIGALFLASKSLDLKEKVNLENIRIEDIENSLNLFIHLFLK